MSPSYASHQRSVWISFQSVQFFMTFLEGLLRANIPGPNFPTSVSECWVITGCCFTQKKTRLWPIEGPLPPLLALWRWFDVAHPMEKENTAAIDWSIEEKNAHHNDCACWKYSQSIESISKTILGSSCRTCASICGNLVVMSYKHRTWWINCAIVSCSFRKTTGSCSKCLAKESLWLCLAGKTNVDHVLLLKAVPHQVLTHILSASLVSQKSIRQPEGNYWKPKIPALVWCVTDDLSPLFSRQKLRKHPSPNCDPRCANKFWSISWSPRLTLACENGLWVGSCWFLTSERKASPASKADTSQSINKFENNWTEKRLKYNEDIMSSALFFIVLCSWQNFNAALNLGNLSIAPPPELLWLACFLTSWPQTKDVELMVNHVLTGKESLPNKKKHSVLNILGFMPRGTCGMTLPAPVRPSTPANHFLFLKRSRYDQVIAQSNSPVSAEQPLGPPLPRNESSFSLGTISRRWVQNSRHDWYGTIMV